MEDSRRESERRGRDECTKTCSTGRTVQGLDVTVGSRNRKESENGVEQGVVRCAKFLDGVDIVDRAESTGVGDGTVRWVMWISEGVDDEVGDGIYRVAGTVLEEYFSSHCSANESGVSFGITQLQQVVLTVRAKIFSTLPQSQGNDWEVPRSGQASGFPADIGKRNVDSACHEAYRPKKKKENEARRFLESRRIMHQSPTRRNSRHAFL